jgi:hypothetical protein
VSELADLEVQWGTRKWDRLFHAMNDAGTARRRDREALGRLLVPELHPPLALTAPNRATRRRSR